MLRIDYVVEPFRDMHGCYPQFPIWPFVAGDRKRSGHL
jgi:hypothetical protein